jgi:hypothetical protein
MVRLSAPFRPLGAETARCRKMVKSCCFIDRRRANDSCSYSDEDKRPLNNAKHDAEMIVHALNLMNGGLP